MADPQPRTEMTEDLREVVAAIHRLDCGCGQPNQHTPDAPSLYLEYAQAAAEVVERRVRAQVAEEIALALEATLVPYPDNGARRPKLDIGEYATDALWAAMIAREHARVPEDPPTPPSLGEQPHDPPPDQPTEES